MTYGSTATSKTASFAADQVPFWPPFLGVPFWPDCRIGVRQPATGRLEEANNVEYPRLPTVLEQYAELVPPSPYCCTPLVLQMCTVPSVLEACPQ
eukprot:797419-Rhodomonas_salina.1